MHVIANTIGIEAARTFIIKRLYNTISNTGSYVHPAHIIFIAEFITSRGIPYGTTFTGISRQPGGHLSLATVERAGKTFTQHALHGRKEDIRNVSASISVGARIAIGNGMCDIAQNITENGKSVTLVNDDVFLAHERDDNAIKNTREIENVGFNFEAEQAKAMAIGALQIEPENLEDKIPNVNNEANFGYVDPLAPRKRNITNVTKLREEPQPIISEGLVILTDIEPSPIGSNIPKSLDDLFDQYKDRLLEYPEYYSTEQLPRAGIPILTSGSLDITAEYRALQQDLQFLV